MNRAIILLVISWVCSSIAETFEVVVLERGVKPVLSFIDGTSEYQQIFNPTWVQRSAGSENKQGIIARTQNCDSSVDGVCTWCGGAQDKASILTFSEEMPDGSFKRVEANLSVVFGPSDETDSWGTEDPRMLYNPSDKLYYMFYTAYNGSAIYLNLATTTNPTSTKTNWKKHGAVFPNMPGSKSAALLLRNSPPHYLLWGDSSIRIAQSNDPTTWPDIGEIFIQTRENYFDSKLVESGPPPLLLSNGDYLFFYNSATVGWPNEVNSAYHVGWVILDGKDPSIIKARSEKPLMGPETAWEKGEKPYTCNAPNVVFLEAAYHLPFPDRFQVFFGGADAVVGSAVIQVHIKP